MNTIGICLVFSALGILGIGYYLLNEIEEKVGKK